MTIQQNETIVIQTPNFPANYEDNQFCRWTVSGPEGAFLLVETTEFLTELNYDWMRYGTGLDPTSMESLLLELSGSQVPIIFKTEGSELWMTFSSDHDKTETGISIKIQVETDGDRKFCNRVWLIHKYIRHFKQSYWLKIGHMIIFTRFLIAVKNTAGTF